MINISEPAIDVAVTAALITVAVIAIFKRSK